MRARSGRGERYDKSGGVLQVVVRRWAYGQATFDHLQALTRRRRTGLSRNGARPSDPWTSQPTGSARRASKQPARQLVVRLTSARSWSAVLARRSSRQRSISGQPRAAARSCCEGSKPPSVSGALVQLFLRRLAMNPTAPRPAINKA